MNHKVVFQKVMLNIIFLKEGNKFIAYAPALDLSTCGDTLKKAEERFNEICQLFLEEINKMGTLEDVLLECGWKKTKHPRKPWGAPIFVGKEEKEIKIPCPA